MKTNLYTAVSWVFLILTSAIAFSADKPLTYYVSTDGDDSSPGTKAEPFATLVRARDELRALRKGETQTPATVIVAPGIYDQRSPLILGKSDSNTTYRAEDSRTATFSGGISIDINELPHLEDEALLNRLPEASRKDVRVIDIPRLVPGWKADAPWPNAFRGYAGWPEVFIGASPMRLARWPNDGYAKIAKVIDRGSRPRFQETPDRPGAFIFKEDEPCKWEAGQEIFLGGYWCHAWYDEVLRVGSIDREKKTVRFVVPHHYGIGGQSKGLYYALNVLETLDQPGEYVYDRDAGRIYLLPVTKAGNSCIVGLSKDPLVRVSAASGIRFEGFVFEAGRSKGIEISTCEDTVIDDCLLRSFPQVGVAIQGGFRCGVARSELYGLGMGGVSLNGGDRTTLTASKHFVTDCTIHHYARLVQTYEPAVRMNGVGQYVAYNHIHNAPHQAIGFGGNDHVIEHNRFEKVCLDTGDAGAIYCGRDWTLQGNVIQKNWFSGLGRSMHHNNWAIYPDDQASGVTAKHNLVVNSPSGFLFGGGRESIIQENLFVRVGKWPIRFDKRGISWKAKHEKTLQAKLAKVPSDEEPWRSRFPRLVGLSTNPKRNWPEGNVILGNISVNSSPDNIDPKVKECGMVADTLQVKSGWMPRLDQGRVVFPEGGPKLPKEFEELIVGPRPRETR